MGYCCAPVSAAISSALVLANSSANFLFVAVRFATACLSFEVAVARFARASAVSCWYSCTWKAAPDVCALLSLRSWYSAAK